MTTQELPTHDTTKPVISTTEARQAVPQGVFYVLAVSLILVVAAFTAIYVF
ncbi:MAG TPA: hypothetical protein VHL34_02410 [Rhizomicrobium sp.]|jgi:hypothetical protein|nr:hypothetical protein [Rhizomicrobium sp.]